MLDIKIETLIIGAFYDFLGYLTSQSKEIVVSSHHDVVPLIEQFKAWCDNHDLDLGDDQISFYIKNWRDVTTQLDSLFD